MGWTSILAIYALVWVISAFILLPLGIKTHDELGLEKTRGQADSAPANFRPGRLAIRATPGSRCSTSPPTIRMVRLPSGFSHPPVLAAVFAASTALHSVQVSSTMIGAGVTVCATAAGTPAVAGTPTTSMVAVTQSQRLACARWAR